MGLMPNMLRSIMALYSHPIAKVKVNCHMSNVLSLPNGTRPGCLLSPFVIALEPFLNMIQSNPNIKGIRIRGKEYKVAVFASDLLLFFLTDP